MILVGEQGGEQVKINCEVILVENNREPWEAVESGSLGSQLVM